MTKVDGIRQSELTQAQKAELQKVEYQKENVSPSIWVAAGGIAAGTYVSRKMEPLFNICNQKIISKVSNMKLSPSEIRSIETAGRKALKASGLAKKGVIICETPWLKNNAFFDPLNNNVAVTADKSPAKMAVFHELGHAKNANLSKIGKLLQKGRRLPLLAVPIALIALYKTKKAEGEQATGVVDKTTDFIKNNAGKLTFATFLPTLIEEAMATFKGNKMAKTFLKPELFKKIAKGNALCYMTYLLGAVGAGAGVFAATKVKDSIASRKEVEFANDDIGKIDKENYYKLREEEIQKFDLNGNGKIDEGKEQKYYQAWKLAKVS